MANFCECKNRRLSHIFNMRCKNCGLPIKCEVKECNNQAESIETIYAVCKEHKDIANKVYYENQKPR